MTELKNVHAGYGKTEILHGVDLKAEPGSVTTLIGHNGCGKSTLLKAMLGMLPITGGEVLLDGMSLQNASPRETARKAAYLAQFHRVGDISVERLVLHGRFPYLSYPRRYGKKDYDAAYSAMERMGIAELAGRQLRTLSGGTVQKAHIAMALAQNASILVMDEPTASLDIGQQLKFMEIIKLLADEGKTIVLVLHDILTALSFSDNIAVMDRGRIIRCAPPEALLQTDIFEKLYGISVNTVQTERGIRYYYDVNNIQM